MLLLFVPAVDKEFNVGAGAFAMPDAAGEKDGLIAGLLLALQDDPGRRRHLGKAEQHNGIPRADDGQALCQFAAGRRQLLYLQPDAAQPVFQQDGRGAGGIAGVEENFARPQQGGHRRRSRVFCRL